MKRIKFTPEQVTRILKEFDQGKSTEQISRERGVSKATYRLYSATKYLHVGIACSNNQS